MKPVDRLTPQKQNIPSRTKLCFWWWNRFKYATLIHLLTLDYFPCQLFFFAEMTSWERSHGTLVVHHSPATIFLLPYIAKTKHSLLKRYSLYTLAGPDFARDLFLLSPLTPPRSPRMIRKFPVLWRKLHYQLFILAERTKSQAHAFKLSLQLTGRVFL